MRQRPLVGRGAGERALQLDGRVQAGVGAVERREEAVALELRPPVRRGGRRAARRAGGGRGPAAPSARRRAASAAAAASAMSLSISVTAPSGELIRLSAGVDRLERRGDHVDRGQSASASGCIPVGRAYLDTSRRTTAESRLGMSGAQTDQGIRISAFPPIGDYAFLSDCETTALVAPNGNVEWLCLPRMDSPSVFAAILDRDAGGFRVGPADVNVPAGRRYIPGTMVLETSWETRMGWVIVRDALCIGPWHHDTERSHSHRRSPTDHDADHVLLRLIECVQGSAEIKLECEPAFDYGGLAVDWEYTGTGYGEAVAPLGGHGPRAAARHRPAARLRGPARAGAHHAARGRRRVRRARLVASTGCRRATRRPPSGWRGPQRFWQEWLKHGTFPDHPWRTHLQRSALTLKGLTYAPSGRADRRRRRRRCPRRRAATATGTTATAGSATRRSRCGRCTRSASTRRPTTSSTSSPTWPRPRRASSRSCTGSAARRKLEEQELEHLSGYEQRAAGADRQRRLQPGPARRVGRGARLDLPAHPLARPAARPAVADHQAPGGARRSSTGASPTAASGRCAASPSTSPPRS